MKKRTAERLFFFRRSLFWSLEKINRKKQILLQNSSCLIIMMMKNKGVAEK